MGKRPSLVVSDKKIFKISANENTLWTLAAMLDFKSAPKTQSGRGPSSEHFWQVWLISVQRFQRRRFKTIFFSKKYCEIISG
jgi:hypothetical protein